MAEEYASVYSGPDIDSAVTRMLRTPGQQFLINPDFSNPVNQRGITEFTGAGFVIDGWYSVNAVNLFRVEDDCISMTHRQTGTTTAQLRQQIECAKSLTGQTVTFSALIKGTKFKLAINDDANSNWIADSGYKNADEYTVISATGVVPENLESMGVYFRISSEGGSFSAKAAALQIGKEQTAFRKENGKWVLNKIHDFGKELAKCQRHQYVLNPDGEKYHMVGGADAFSNTTVYLFIPLPVTLRANPEVSFVGTWQLQNAEARNDVTGMSFYRRLQNGVVLKVTSSNLVPGAYYKMDSGNTTGCKIIIDANLMPS